MMKRLMHLLLNQHHHTFLFCVVPNKIVLPPIVGIDPCYFVSQSSILIDSCLRFNSDNHWFTFTIFMYIFLKVWESPFCIVYRYRFSAPFGVFNVSCDALSSIFPIDR